MTWFSVRSRCNNSLSKDLGEKHKKVTSKCSMHTCVLSTIQNGQQLGQPKGSEHEWVKETISNRRNAQLQEILFCYNIDGTVGGHAEINKSEGG